MSSRLDRFTLGISIALVMGALLACKKKKDESTTPSATATAEVAPTAAPPTAAPAATPAAAPAEPAGPKLGDVKRYPDKEKKSDESAVKVLEEDVKVFNEADVKTPEVATLPKDLIVIRLSTLEQEAFTLVNFPSGIGQFSPGWVETKFLEQKGEKVAEEKVLAQTKTATIKTTKPATSTAAVTSAAPKSSSAAAASASAAIAAAAKSAAPLTSAAAAAAASAAKAVTPATSSTAAKKKKRK